MATHEDELPAIEQPNERWEPNPDPRNIQVHGLDTTAPVQDQIEQIEQLITIRLQVGCHDLTAYMHTLLMRFL